jgi:hypothetical protein
MEQRPKITVETLLRLKRAERPDAEFWTSFERELRQKQLAALLERRPWWQNLPRLLSRRAYLPIGAAAVVAFTLVSVKYYAPSQAEGAPEAAVPVTPANVASIAPSGAVAQVANQEIPSSAAPSIDDRTAVVADLSLSDNLPAHAAELLPWSAPRPVEKSSARLIAENLARLGQPDLELTTPRIEHAPLPAAPRAVEVATPTIELATVSALASKRNRLLAELADRRFTPEPQAPEIVRERLSRRLADPEFAERFSRIGVQGDRVLVKF